MLLSCHPTSASSEPWKIVSPRLFSQFWSHVQRFRISKLGVLSVAVSGTVVQHDAPISHGSGRSGCECMRRLLWLLIFIMQVHASAAHKPTQNLEVIHQTSMGTCRTATTTTWPKKRAYQQACRRAQQRGGTMYKGRWHTESTLNAQCMSRNSPPQRTQQTQQLKSRHLRVMTWNWGHGWRRV